jgi:hypothetical protein
MADRHAECLRNAGSGEVRVGQVSIDIIADSDEPRVAGSDLLDIRAPKPLSNRYRKKIKQTPRVFPVLSESGIPKSGGL